MTIFKTKSPIKTSLLFSFFSVLKAGISILLLPVFLNYLNPEEYGIISLVTIYATIITTFGALGLKNALFTFYFDFKSRVALKQYLGNLFSFHLIAFAILLVVHLLIGDQIFNIIFASNNLQFFNYGLIALVGIMLSVLNSVYFVFLKNELNLNSFSKYSFCSIAITAFSQIVLITVYNLKIYGLLLGILIPNAIIFIVICITNSYLLTLNFKTKLLKPSLNYSLKLLPFLLFFAFENQVDKYLIELNLGLKEVGLYAILLKLFGLLIIAINALDDGIRPFLFMDLQQGKTTANNYFNLYFGASIFVLFTINTLGYNLEYFISNPDYLVIKDYIFLCTIAFLLTIPVRFFGLLLVYNKAALKLSYITSIKIVVFILLMLYLLPKYQLFGALYALVLSQIANIILFVIILPKKNRVFPTKKTLFFIAFFVLSSYYLHRYFTSNFKLTLSLLYYFLAVVLFSILYLKATQKIIKLKIKNLKF